MDWDFWAIQTKDPSFTVWVNSDAVNHEFNREIIRRFGEPKSPMALCADSKLDIRAFVFWPPAEYGQPLYRMVKRHRWSLRTGLVYFRE